MKVKAGEAGNRQEGADVLFAMRGEPEVLYTPSFYWKRSGNKKGKKMMTKAKRGKAIIGIAMAAIMLSSLVTLVPAVSAEAPENESFKLTSISIFKFFNLKRESKE